MSKIRQFKLIFFFIKINFGLLIVGSKVHEVRLQAEQGNVLTVQDLVKKINEVTEIPPANQKILYKGLLTQKL